MGHISEIGIAIHSFIVNKNNNIIYLLNRLLVLHLRILPFRYNHSGTMEHGETLETCLATRSTGREKKLRGG